MLDFDIRKPTRRCHASGRDLNPGETFFSVLVPEGSGCTRRDFSADAWQGPPEEAIGWWKSHMPAAGATRLKMAPPEVLIDYFEQLGQVAGKETVRFVMALLLVRKRLAKWEETTTDDAGQRTMVLDCPRTGQKYQVLQCDPAPEEIESIQQELMQTLYAEAE